MFVKKKHIILLLFFFIQGIASAQIIGKHKNDTLPANKGVIIEHLDKKKNKNGFNKILNKLFVRKSKTANSTTKKTVQRKLNFSVGEGKIIRNIKINTLDPFGFSIDDSTRQPSKFIEKAGNALHNKTKNFVIRNYLLQKPGDELDSLKILESERLLRSQRFSRRVRIDFEIVGENHDSVDLIVNTLDSWTIYPSITFSSSKVGFKLRDRNFLGLGHDFNNYYRQNFESGKNQFLTRYTIPNIQRSFINFGIGYSSNEENEYTKGISLNRKFFSPLTRWAGGAYVGQRVYQDSIPNNFGVMAQNFKYNLSDFWGAYAFHLFDSEKNIDNRLSNFIISARYFGVNYNKRPIPALDPNNFYANEDFFLVGMGISRRGFVQDKFIQNFDIVEDIPVGLSYGITSGIQRKNHKDRFYLAGNFKSGNYHPFGYLGYQIQYGGFITKKEPQQSVLSLNFNYYTRLMSWNDWKFRSFLSSYLILGNNRVDSRGDRLTLNENDPLGINGFYSLDVIGTKKWLTNFQFQSYSPYQILGFRLSPVLTSSIGIIGDNDHSLLKGKLYTKIGLGLLLTNDYLIFSNFQLSFAWYNNIPGQGDNLFKANTFQISDYELMDFDFGKPELIEYNPFVTN